MNCHHKDCDTCPYPDCILNGVEAVARAIEDGMYDQEIAEREQKRIEARRRANLAYYYRNKKKMNEYAKAYHARKRAEKNGMQS